ncbi:hypothetical protein GCM10028862_22780 [Luteimonas pelagia]
MFNPRPRIEVVPVTPRHACVVVDDALADPDAWVERAAAHAAAFRGEPGNAYPGPELPLPEVVATQFDRFFSEHARVHLGARRVLRSHCRLSITTRPPGELAPRQWIPHVDRLEAGHGQSIAASVLYLFRDAALGGTSFYRPRRPLPEIAALVQDSAALDADAFSARHGIPRGYPDDSDWFAKVATVPARFNRLVFYDGTLFHAGEIRAPDRLDPDPRRGRLTLNGFFLCRRSLAPGDAAPTGTSNR